MHTGFTSILSPTALELIPTVYVLDTHMNFWLSSQGNQYVSSLYIDISMMSGFLEVGHGLFQLVCTVLC